MIERTHIIKDMYDDTLLILRSGSTRKEAFALYCSEYRKKEPWAKLIEIDGRKQSRILLASPDREIFRVYVKAYDSSGKLVREFLHVPLVKNALDALLALASKVHYREKTGDDWPFTEISINSLHEIGENDSLWS
jgi:hypothetical protein